MAECRAMPYLILGGLYNRKPWLLQFLFLPQERAAGWERDFLPSTRQVRCRLPVFGGAGTLYVCPLPEMKYDNVLTEMRYGKSDFQIPHFE